MVLKFRQVSKSKKLQWIAIILLFLLLLLGFLVCWFYCRRMKISVQDLTDQAFDVGQVVEYGASSGLELVDNSFSVKAPVCQDHEYLTWDGQEFVCTQDRVEDDDSSPYNELNTNIVFNPTTARLSVLDAGGVLSADLSMLRQNLSLNGSLLSISNGNTVDLSGLVGSGTSVDYDEQTLSLNNTTLSISNGNSVTFYNWDTDVTDDVTSFVQLQDTPNNYGSAGQVVQTDGNGALYYSSLDQLQLGSISQHSDVDTVTSPPTSGQVLIWDGTNWVPGNVTGSGTSTNIYNSRWNIN